MFYQHAVLVLLKNNENKGIILFLFELVPICPALFLFISGFSLIISYQKRQDLINNNYYLHLLKRGFILIVFSTILFLIEYGFQFPDLIVSSGILNTIGLMIIISTLFLMLPYKKIFLSVFIIIIILAAYLLEITKINLIPFNHGYEPIVPTITFGLIGLLIGLLLNQYKENIKKERIFMLLLGVFGIFIFLYFSIKYGIFKIFFSDIGRYYIERTFNESYFLNNIFSGAMFNNFQITVSVWNFSTECFFASLGVVFMFFSGTYFLEKYFKKFLPDNVFIPGRFAFFNYFYHLAVIALFVIIFGYNIFSLKHFLIFLSVLFFSSYVFSYLLLIIKKNRSSK